MEFMERQVEYGEWWEVDTKEGIFYVPIDVAGRVKGEDELSLHEAFLARVELVRDYVDVPILDETNCYGVDEIEGWGARLSAPGFMDCTEWSVFDSEEEAEEYLDELEGDNDYE